MPDIRKLIREMAAQEEAFRQTVFVAPCVRGGRVRARVAGLVQTFAPRPRDFEGWGVFRPVSGKVAEVVEVADLPLIARYLEMLKPLRMALVYALEGKSWLAYPANESDMRQRWGDARPVAVHLVTEGAYFEPIIARSDGAAWWFEEVDRRADPQMPERLRKALRKVTLPEELRFKGLTPEMRTVYDLAAQQTAEFAARTQRRRDETRLNAALQMAGGALRDFRDRGDFWQVEWTTNDGARHTSAISKRDLTVISSGICLSGRDQHFDLQSLVGVMEQRWEQR